MTMTRLRCNYPQWLLTAVIFSAAIMLTSVNADTDQDEVLVVAVDHHPITKGDLDRAIRRSLFVTWLNTLDQDAQAALRSNFLERVAPYLRELEPRYGVGWMMPDAAETEASSEALTEAAAATAKVG